ncbi:hypothetical protein [Lacinutrix algicola]|uniref:hypothetical protein n=1 Tax=Lacinutrix algicola TaxID=342954 RepID=UPI0006E25D24|nr:hypothetical protein [Lacinutrix algicola]
MKIRVLFLLILVSVLNCKAAKERKQCLELVNGKTPLEINSFEEFKNYIDGYVDYEKVVWVVDNALSSKEGVLKLIDNKNLININSIRGANGSQLDGEDNGVLIITTNKCLEKIK